jgi:hypothetical protein
VYAMYKYSLIMMCVVCRIGYHTMADMHITCRYRRRVKWRMGVPRGGEHMPVRLTVMAMPVRPSWHPVRS